MNVEFEKNFVQELQGVRRAKMVTIAEEYINVTENQKTFLKKKYPERISIYRYLDKNIDHFTKKV